MANQNEFLTTKEIAGIYRKTDRWVYSLKRLGLPMPGRVARLEDVNRILERFPAPLTAERRMFGRK